MLQIWVSDGYVDVGDLVHDHFPELLHEDLDEPISDPESIRAEFLESLRTAQDEGSVRRRINKQRVEEMLKIQARDEYYSIENLIQDHFPELLTQSGKNS